MGAGLYLLSCLLASPGEPPREDTYVYRELPSIDLETADGSRTSLARLWSEGPLVVTMVFSRCSGACSPFLRSVKSAVEAVGADDVRMIVLSFDPRDTSGDLRGWSESLGLAGRPGWTFAVARADQVRQLALASGFWFAWDEERQQYDHPSLLVAIRKGRLIRMLAGATVPPLRFAEVVDELRGRFVPAYPVPGKVSFRCFDYDPVTGRLRFDWGMLLLAFPGAVSFAATAMVFIAARARRRVNATGAAARRCAR